MTTIENIKKIVSQIMYDSEVCKPDLYCSEDIFWELSQRPDCKIHPTQKETLVMLPNVYWALDIFLTVPNIKAHTRRGELILKYLELVSYYIFEENGSLIEIHNIVQDILKNI